MTPDPFASLAAASEPYRPDEPVVELDALTDTEEDDE